MEKFKKEILIASFDLEVGGVERSLISMLDNFDYENNNVDLMLYSHTGDFMNLLTDKINLLDENKKYKTFRKGIGQIIKDGNLLIGTARMLARYKGKSRNTGNNIESVSQMQYMWKYSMPFLPKIDKEYDVAISYLWPHYFIAEKVKARIKIAWIHTDYSTIETDIKEDLRIWNKFNYIISISEECTKAFINKYPSLKNRVVLIENITSPNFVICRSNCVVDDDLTRCNAFKIVSTGRLCYQKAFDNAIKSLRILHDRGLTQIKWYVVGYGGDEQMLRKIIKENKLEDSFILLGKKTNPYPYMKACDLYVQPSRYEGKAVTVTEAKILGKPIVITDYPTAKSQITNGVDGYITELSVKGIADGIEKLYKDKELRNRLSINCINSDYSNKYELENLYRLFV